jgi:hypothetical protein
MEYIGAWRLDMAGLFVFLCFLLKDSNNDIFCGAANGGSYYMHPHAGNFMCHSYTNQCSHPGGCHPPPSPIPSSSSNNQPYLDCASSCSQENTNLQKEVDALKGQLETMHKVVFETIMPKAFERSSPPPSLSALEERIGALKSSLSASEERIGALESRPGNDWYENVDVCLGELNERLEELEEKEDPSKFKDQTKGSLVAWDALTGFLAHHQFLTPQASSQNFLLHFIFIDYCLVQSIVPLLALRDDALKKEFETREDALKKEFEARQDALKKEFEAREEALKARVESLKKGVDARVESLKKDTSLEKIIRKKFDEIESLCLNVISQGEELQKQHASMESLRSEISQSNKSKWGAKLPASLKEAPMVVSFFRVLSIKIFFPKPFFFQPCKDFQELKARVDELNTHTKRAEKTMGALLSDTISKCDALQGAVHKTCKDLEQLQSSFPSPQPELPKDLANKVCAHE